MVISKNGYIVDRYETSYAGRHIMVAIDSSKSNSAFVVANMSGVILDDYEINGAGENVDVYDLCWQTRKQLTELFRGSIIELVGIEDIITKKQGKYAGMYEHKSRSKITAVFNNFIFFFQDHHNKMPVLINNQSWKSHVLPEEYRTRAYDKGSKAWLYDLGHPYGNRTDDICDAYCIMQYLKHEYHIHYSIDVTDLILTPIDYNLYVMPKRYGPEELIVDYAYNPAFSFDDNVLTVANMAALGTNAFMQVPTAVVPIELIYGKTFKDEELRFSRDVKDLYICIQRY